MDLALWLTAVHGYSILKRTPIDSTEIEDHLVRKLVDLVAANEALAELFGRFGLVEIARERQVL